jgi:hypothetical protein
MTQRVTTSTEAPVVTLSPLARVVRTVIQTVVSFAAVEPILIGLVHANAATATEAASITAGVVFIASTVQNVLEHFGVLPTVGGKAVA